MKKEIVLSELNVADRIDAYEAALLTLKQCPYKLIHRFTPGLYSRELYMLKGTSWTSEEHITHHQFVVLEGLVSVYTEADGEVVLGAGHMGETKPGTKRVLFIHENTRWITFHPTDIYPEDNSEEAVVNAVAKIKEKIIGKHVNPFLEADNIIHQINNL